MPRYTQAGQPGKGSVMERYGPVIASVP